MHIGQIQEKLKHAVELSLHSLSKSFPSFKPPKKLVIELEIPKDPRHGDLTTNAAMRLSKYFSASPIELAKGLKDELEKRLQSSGLSSVVGRIDALPPGFVNVYFSKAYLYDILAKIAEEKKNFGKSFVGKGIKVNIEFVSANPTGPLTVAHGRQAAVGDALARILKFAGYSVCREYFINDAGTQIELLGRSIYARYLERQGSGKNAKFPEDGYHGNYIREIADEIFKKYGTKFASDTAENLDFITDFGVHYILRTIANDLNMFGVFFDKWFSQTTLSKKAVMGVLAGLRRKGFVYDRDGATWFKSTAFADDKDRVVVKQNGSFTYLAPDIAYHLNKYRRGFHRLIDIWGPDHHGYISRMKAAVRAIGYKEESISILIVQLATLFRGGLALSMSTRKGEFITLKEVINEVGSDVAKFFFLMRKLDSHLDFDLEVAKKSSLDNPVYYIQYAHARIASILHFSGKINRKLLRIKYDAALLREDEELRILRMLSVFPFTTELSAEELEPYRLVDYLNELAKIFHSFYTKHRVVSEDNLPLTKARLALVNAVKAALANGLELLGISLPERM